MKTPDITLGELADLQEADGLSDEFGDLKGEIARFHERLFGWERSLPPPSDQPPLDAARIAELLKG